MQRFFWHVYEQFNSHKDGDIGIADLYKARWEVELLFKELKQTLQLQDFYVENEKAVEWQIWAALLTHLLLRYLKYKSGARCS